MGAYLSTPVTDKEVEEGEGPNLQYGVAAMQGWRRTMEDGADSSTAAGQQFAGSRPVWRPFLRAVGSPALRVPVSTAPVLQPCWSLSSS